MPVAFIDWDAAQPADQLTDLAAAAWAFVPLVPPGQLAEAGFDPLPDLAARLRMFVDAYGLTDASALHAGRARTTALDPGHVARSRPCLVTQRRAQCGRTTTLPGSGETLPSQQWRI
jgi:aminoglycoside phosphotransferase (APT) family kinase protein